MITTEIEPEMESIVDFVNETETTMDVLLTHENPYRSQASQQGMVHWSCKIICENRFVIIYFSKGIGLRLWIQPPQIGGAIPLHVPHDKIGQSYDGPKPPFETEQDKRTFTLCSQPEPPFLIEVLDVLARDMSLVEQAGSFDDWAVRMESSPDNQAARTAFDIVCRQRIELIALFGEGTYHKLLYEIDRLPQG